MKLRTNKLVSILTGVMGLSMMGMSAAEAADKIKVGLMLPATGTYAKLGSAITNGFKLYVDENGGKIAGLPVEYAVVDDESDPAKATENANKLVKRDEVDVLIGTVHSGVAMAMAKVARGTKTLMIVPNAGANELTGPLCAPNVFRTSFSAWQPSYAMGPVLLDKGIKRVVTLTWKYSFGLQSVEAFKESFTAGGGEVVKELTLPFPNTEFQPYLTEIAALKPDAVFVFFAGGGAVKFVKDYAAAGLKDSIPLYGSGFLTDGTLAAMGGAGEGVETTLHYAEGLDVARDKTFRTDYAKAFGSTPDVYAVQGYDAAQLLAAGVAGVKGNIEDRGAMIKAMEAARIDSPRGEFSMSAAHNPVQNIYLRKAEGEINPVVKIAAEALSDPAKGCRMQ